MQQCKSKQPHLSSMQSHKPIRSHRGRLREAKHRGITTVWTVLWLYWTLQTGVTPFLLPSLIVLKSISQGSTQHFWLILAASWKNANHLLLAPLQGHTILVSERNLRSDNCFCYEAVNKFWPLKHKRFVTSFRDFYEKAKYQFLFDLVELMSVDLCNALCLLQYKIR